MKNYTNCPVCNHTSFDHYLKCKDYTVSHETFNIVKCENCDFVFTNPIPLESEIDKCGSLNGVDLVATELVHKVVVVIVNGLTCRLL